MTLEKILRFTVLTGLFAIPFVVLIVFESLLFPFVSGKNFAFRILIEIIFSVWVLLALLNARYRPRWTPLLISVVIFIGIVALADVFGENFFKSFWSNFERMEGLITLLHLFAYLIMAVSVLAREDLWIWFWRVSLGVSFVVSIHTIFQSFSTDATRLFSTLGNPIYLAVYMLFHIFIAAILAAQDKATRSERIVYMVLIALQIWVLYLTATRGATLGLIGGMFLATCGILFSYRHEKRSRIIALTGVMVLIVLVGSFALARNSDFVQDSPVLKRFSNLSLSDQTIFARTVLWGMAWEGVKEKPLLGWGQGNFNLVFAKYYDPRMYSNEQWFDRTHNIVFDWLVAAGILGLLAYISIFLALLWVIYKTENFNIVQKWLLVGLLAAYSFSNLTVFDTLTSYILFFSILAWVYVAASDVSIECKEDKKHPREISEKMALMIGVPTMFVFSVLLVWSINATPIYVGRGVIFALQDAGYAQIHAGNGSFKKASEFADKSLKTFQTLETKDAYGKQAMRELWATTAGRFAREEWLSSEAKQEWYLASRSALEAQQSLAPDDPRFPFFLGDLHGWFGNNEASWGSMLRANELTPNKQTILLQLGAKAANANNFEVAESFAKKAFESERTYTNARILYAFILIRSDRDDEALVLLEEEPSAALNSRILAAYVQKGDHEGALSMWELGIPGNENDASKLFSLALVYVQKSDKERVRAEVSRIVTMYPGAQKAGESVLEKLK